MKNRFLNLIIIVVVFSLACTTKVSEWVLLNSVPDKYILVYFHKNEITESVKRQNAELERRFNSANILVKSMQRDEIEKPYYGLYFNNRLVTEYAGEKELLNIASSPVRENIANELMSGKLCVMLYLKCGNPEKDEAGLQVVKNSVTASPFGDVITVMELERKSTEESQLVSMLLNVESDLKEIEEPMLFGIFGKFRALEPLLAKGISQENINLMIDFLTADCSCLIKDDLPGTNILYNGKWENPQTALVNKILDDNPNLEHH
jgi:hypothetical protein